jgi:hypothetical protein
LNKQQQFRSGVGMLFYLVKHSRPDLANAVRELSKVMDGATLSHVKMLYRVIKYVLNTNNRGIRVKPNQENGCIAYAITGYLIYLCGVPIAWKSRQQGGITLSSSEAEYYAISEVAKEMKFVKMILDFLEIDTG